MENIPSHIQQWQLYNSLDKTTSEPKYIKSKKFPYFDKDKIVTKDELLKPKVSTLGVIPTRESGGVKDVMVMISGKSFLNSEELVQLKDQAKKPHPKEESAVNGKNVERGKLPVIFGKVGTTTHIQFSKRKKPRRPKRSKLKKLEVKEEYNIAPPNSQMSTRSLSSVSLSRSLKTRFSEKAEIQPNTPPSSPSEKMLVTARHASARSVDEIIKHLRTSKEGNLRERRSSSENKINQLMKQVLGDTAEWYTDESGISDDNESGNESIKDGAIKAVSKLADGSDEEDLSDSVSTLASQLSAPAGIPNVEDILLRKSSAAIQPLSIDESDFSSPILGNYETEEYVNTAQALKDLRQSLNVTNEDILNVEGQKPPLIKPQVSRQAFDDESIFMNSNDSAVFSFDGSHLSSTVISNGRIHHLCLLDSSVATLVHFPSDNVAQSSVLHAPGKFKRTIKKLEEKNSGDPAMEATNKILLPPAPPPTQLRRNTEEQTTRSLKEETTEEDRRQSLKSVVDQVEAYNNPQIAEKKTPPRIKLDDFDTSKVDALDIATWKRLAEDYVEEDVPDLTQQGVRCSNKDTSIWRLMWNAVPPKMALPPKFIQASLFPKYNSATIVHDVITQEDIETSDYEISDEEEDMNSEKPEFNLRTLFRRHKSVEDSRTFEGGELNKRMKRSSSQLCLSVFDPEKDHKFTKMRTDYKTAMEELQQQRDVAMAREAEDKKIVEIRLLSSKSKQQGDIIMPSTHTPVAKTKPKSSDPALPTEHLSQLDSQITAASSERNIAKSYVTQAVSKKSRKKARKSLAEKAREILTQYQPLTLSRSNSVERGICRYNPSIKIVQRKRSRSLPKVVDFVEFQKQYQDEDEHIEDMREWVRNIWNEWFDEVYPEPESDSSSESSYRSTGDEYDEEIASSVGHASSVSSAAPKVPLKIPDSLPPVIVHEYEEEGFEDDVSAADPEKTIDDMKQDVEVLQEEINQLKPHETTKRAVLLTRKGAVLRKLGEIKLAKADLDLAISLEPQITAAYWYRHLIKLLHNQLHEALDDLNILLRNNKKHVHAYRSRADVFAQLGDYTMAIVNYGQAIKLNPGDDDAYYQRAHLHEKKGDMLLALEDYANAVRINPDRTDALKKRGLYNFTQKNWHAANTDFTQLIEKEPLNAMARTYRGRIYAATKQYNKAVVDLSAAIHLDPLNWRAFYHRACILRTAMPEKALQDLSTSLLIDDSYDNAMSLLHRGILYTELKRFQEAVTDFEEALRLDHTLVCAHVNIGLVHLQVTENYTEAIYRFTNALKVNPTYSRAYMCRCEAYIKNGDHKKALYDVTRSIHLCPNNRDLYLRRGYLLLQLGELELASFCVRHISTFGKGIVSTSATQQAVVQSFLKNHDTAIQGLQAACRVKPAPSMYILLGKTLMKAKKYQEAIASFRNALELLLSFSFSTTSSSSSSVSTGITTSLEVANINFFLGQCYIQVNQNTNALQVYNQCLRSNSNHALAYYERGLCRLKMGHSKGILDLNRALALDSSLFEAYLSRAAYYGMKKRYTKGILNCNEALRLRPESIRALLYRGALKYHIYAYKLAICDLTHAIKLDKNNSLAYFNRATCYQKTKQFRLALKDYSIVLILEEENESSKQNIPKPKSLPLSFRVYVNRGLLYMRDLNDAYNAALDFEKATTLQENNIETLHTMALCYHNLHILKDAIASYSRCLEVDPYFLEAYIGRGDVHAIAGDVFASRSDYQRALKLNPLCLSARIHLGYSLQAENQLQQAWNQFTRAIDQDECCQLAYEGRSITCLKAGNTDAAFKDISCALSVGKKTARLHTARGVVFHHMRDVRNAMMDYQHAIQLDKKYVTAYFNASVLYLRNSRYKEAAEYLDVVIELSPSDAAAWLNRGITRVMMNDYLNALSDFNQSISLNSHNAHAYFNKGNLLALTGDLQKADVEYSRALGINPGDFAILKKRADVRGLLGMKEEAIADYRNSILLRQRIRRLQQINRN